MTDDKTFDEVFAVVDAAVQKHGGWHSGVVEIDLTTGKERHRILKDGEWGAWVDGAPPGIAQESKSETGENELQNVDK